MPISKPLTTPANRASTLAQGIYCSFTAQPMESVLKEDNLLFAVGYHNDHSLNQRLQAQSPKYLTAGLETFAGHLPLNEVWRCDKPVSSGKDDGVAWSQNEDFLFATVTWNDQSDQELHNKTVAAYGKLLHLIESRGYPHLIRIWNYLSAINSGSGDRERYRLFCQGRHEAFINNGYPMSQFPSASGLGHCQNDNRVYLIASKFPGLHFENPQQVSAYLYPRQHGPRSPSFARATVLEHRQTKPHRDVAADVTATVFVSGTASIIGHETKHRDNCMGQLEVTFHNLDALLSNVCEQAKKIARPILLKVYVRREADLEPIKARVVAHMGENVQVLYLHGDICRRELLVEIEGVYGLSALSKPAESVDLQPYGNN